jgi:hypothetical protein
VRGQGGEDQFHSLRLDIGFSFGHSAVSRVLQGRYWIWGK